MRPRLLLHACCAPCSIAIIDELRSAHDLTVFFHNPNIQPLTEYEKRKAEVIRVCREWGVPLIDWDYDADRCEREVGATSQLKEGGARCAACIRLRLATAADYARRHGFERWATSLAMSRQKASSFVNGIGREVAAASGVPFLDVDWKKGGRTEKALRMVAERGIYRQDYCGCRHSLAASEGRQRR